MINRGYYISENIIRESNIEIILSRYTHDDVGRFEDQGAWCGDLHVQLNVRGWMTRISGLRFNQTLAYNTPENGITPDVPLYGGNISAMKWKSGNESTERGYRFSYDNLGRLTAAVYGEGVHITANPDRFNEVLSYDRMGNITTLQRRGKLNSGYGPIDNLTYTYTGNQLTKVTDAVTTPVTYENAFHFVDRANAPVEYEYDDNGNLTKDSNRNIPSITYNSLNLPEEITFADGNGISYGYGASSGKLQVQRQGVRPRAGAGHVGLRGEALRPRTGKVTRWRRNIIPFPPMSMSAIAR